jgi:hypothetical protein
VRGTRERHRCLQGHRACAVKDVNDCCDSERLKSTYAIVVLTGSASRLGVELARAASGHLVGDSLDVVVGGRHCCLELNLEVS